MTHHRPLARPTRSFASPLALEIAPALHRDLTTVKFAFAVAVSRTFGPLLLAGGKTRVAPAEIVEVPVGVGWEYEVPDWEGEEVDEHPEDVAEAVGSDDDEDAGETEDEGEEDEGNEWGGRVFCCGFESDDACERVSLVYVGSARAGNTYQRRL